MQKHTFYRVLSIILIPVAVLYGLAAFLFLFAALANPPLLLPVFMMICIVIYTFTSFKFLNKGILRAQPCKPSLKDLIKVNALVSLIVSLISISQSVKYLIYPQSIKDSLEKMHQFSPNSSELTKEMLAKAMNVSLYISLFISINADFLFEQN